MVAVTSLSQSAGTVIKQIAMPHVSLPAHRLGITGLLDYRLDTAVPIRQLTQLLLRGESTLSEGERELIAALVSSRNGTDFCNVTQPATPELPTGTFTIRY